MATTLLRWLHPRPKDQLESCSHPLIPLSPGLGRRGIGSVDPITDAYLGGSDGWAREQVERAAVLSMPPSMSTPKHMLMSMPELATQVQTGSPVTVCCLQETQHPPVQSSWPSRCDSPSWLRPARGEWHGWCDGDQARSAEWESPLPIAS